MSESEFSDWKYFLDHEREIFRSAELTISSDILYTLAMLKWMMIDNFYTNKKEGKLAPPRPEYRDYVPNETTEEKMFRKKMDSRKVKKMTKEEREAYKKKLTEEAKARWAFALTGEY